MSRFRSVRTALAASLFPVIGVLVPAATPLAQTETPKMTTQEQQVVDLLKAIETGAAEPVGVIDAASYTQHNLGVAEGLAGFGAALAALPPGSA